MTTAKFFIWCYKIQVQNYMVSKFSQLLAFKIPSLFLPLPYPCPCSFSLAHQSANITMMSTLDPDAEQHLCALQSTMQPFIRLMKSDDHNE